MRNSIILAMGSLLCLAATAPILGFPPLDFDVTAEKSPQDFDGIIPAFPRNLDGTTIAKINARGVDETVIFNDDYGVKFSETSPDNMTAELDARDVDTTVDGLPTDGLIIGIIGESQGTTTFEINARDNPTSGEIVSIDEVLDTTISAPVKREHPLSAELKNLHDIEREIVDNRSLMPLND